MMPDPARPIPVIVVRAKKRTSEAYAAYFLVAVLGIWPTTWIVMLLMGAILPPLLGPQWALGYWQTMGLILLVRLILPKSGRTITPTRDEIKEV